MDFVNTNERELFALISRSPYASLKNIKILVDFFGNLQVAQSASEPNWNICFSDEKIRESFIDVLTRESGAYIARLLSLGISWVIYGEKDYPSQLLTIKNPPIILYYKGNLPANNVIAVVGSRKMSSYGRVVTEAIVQMIYRNFYTCVSGLAFGIDTVAHQTALHEGGKTFAVLPCGLDDIVPQTHNNLANQIIENGGGILSEEPLGHEVVPYSFPKRNRIIAGLSQAIIVVEAAEKSGALYTAAHGLKNNRLVFSVPGSILSETSVGTNRLLINKEVYPYISEEDFLEKCHILKNNKLPIVDTSHDLLLQCINQPKTFDEIASELKIDESQLISLLTILELKGYIKNSNGRWHRSSL